MLRIHDSIREVPARTKVTSVWANVVSANYVYAAIAETVAPHEPVLRHEAVKRVSVVADIVLGAIDRLGAGEQDAAHLVEELSPREAEVIWLVASGQIDLHRAEVQ